MGEDMIYSFLERTKSRTIKIVRSNTFVFLHNIINPSYTWASSTLLRSILFYSCNDYYSKYKRWLNLNEVFMSSIVSWAVCPSQKNLHYEKDIFFRFVERNL